MSKKLKAKSLCERETVKSETVHIRSMALLNLVSLVMSH